MKSRGLETPRCRCWTVMVRISGLWRNLAPIERWTTTVPDTGSRIWFTALDDNVQGTVCLPGTSDAAGAVVGVW